MHNLSVPSFFFKNKIGAPQGETLGLMYFLSISSWSCDLCFVSSVLFIQYGAFPIGTTPSMRSIVKSISLFKEIQGTSSEKLSSYFFKTGMSSSWSLLPFYLPFII